VILQGNCHFDCFSKVKYWGCARGGGGGGGGGGGYDRGWISLIHIKLKVKIHS
jgi:hypothetical protein